MRPILCIFLILALADSALAGSNAKGKAWLSWDRDRVTAQILKSPSSAFPLYLQLSDAPDIQSLAVDLRWVSGDSAGCYSFVSSSGDLICGWATDTLPGGDFEGDSGFTWTISFLPGSARTCVAYTVTAAECAVSQPARFWLASVRAKDTAGSVDSLEILGQATIGPEAPVQSGWRLQAGLAHQFASTIYDPVRHRMVLFGGVSSQFSNLVWELPLAGAGRWHPIRISGDEPSPRAGAVAIYDSIRDRMVIFGGWDAKAGFDEVWALDLVERRWTRLEPGGPSPGYRETPKVIYDPVGDRMVLFGGVWKEEGEQNDVWTLSFSPELKWTRLEPRGTPPLLHGTSAVYDPGRRRMLVCGGSPTKRFDDVWELSLDGEPTWSRLTIVVVLPYRFGHTAVFDPAGDRMIVFGGWVRGEPWFDHAAGVIVVSFKPDLRWTLLKLPDPQPQQRVGNAAFWDPVRGRMVVSGGYYYDRGPGHRLSLNDTWALDIESGVWEPLADPKGPGTRAGHSATYDPVGRRMLVFGGLFLDHAPDLWSLSLDKEFRWTGLVWSGAHPTPWLTPTVYDSRRGRIILIGDAGDAWALTLSDTPTWTQIASGYTEFGNYVSYMYDPVRDRVVQFGRNRTDEVFELALDGTPPTWRPLPTSGPWPGTYASHTATYDPVRDRMVVYGGVRNGETSSEVWVLSLADARWSRLDPIGPAPEGRIGHEVVYDGARDRMLVLGGDCSKTEVWELGMGDPPRWRRLELGDFIPAPRNWGSAVYDPANDRVVVFGGSCDNGTVGETWFLDLRAQPDAVLLSAQPTADHVALSWQMVEGSVDRAFLYRRESLQSWTAFAELPPDQEGAMVYDDRAIHPNTLYSYGLGFEQQESEPTVGIVSVRTPDAATTSLISRVQSTAEPGRVSIVWRSSRPGAEFQIDRRRADQNWTLIMVLEAQPNGDVVLEDNDVVAGERYDYRLRLEGSVLDEFEVLVPRTFQMSLKPLTNPAQRAITLSFTLSGSGPAELRLLDITGRVRIVRKLDARAPGSGVLRLEESEDLSSGIYWASLAQGARTVSARVCIVR